MKSNLWQSGLCKDFKEDKSISFNNYLQTYYQVSGTIQYHVGKLHFLCHLQHVNNVKLCLTKQSLVLKNSLYHQKELSHNQV